MKINRKKSNLSEIVDATELIDFTLKAPINNIYLIFYFVMCKAGPANKKKKTNKRKRLTVSLIKIRIRNL